MAYTPYLLANGKVVRIPMEEIQKQMRLLRLTKDEAIQMWLEDEGYLENPPINYKRLEYLKSLIAFLEGVGIRAENNAPKIK